LLDGIGYRNTKKKMDRVGVEPTTSASFSG
jgi:hypothetical protein